MTKPQRRTLEYVQQQQGIWSSVGIPVARSMAKRLVAAGWAEWAQPYWVYPKPVFAIRLTVAGEVALIVY